MYINESLILCIKIKSCTWKIQSVYCVQFLEQYFVCVSSALWFNGFYVCYRWLYWYKRLARCDCRHAARWCVLCRDSCLRMSIKCHRGASVFYQCPISVWGQRGSLLPHSWRWEIGESASCITADQRLVSLPHASQLVMRNMGVSLMTTGESSLYLTASDGM